ncbi:MAG: tyrosine-type recombinase/integrase [Planctomycetota bacterium]|nr:MAG: tyrosine-type recombinase/integrase [Planctomycetota bacterium]
MGRIYKRGRSWYLDITVKGRRIRRRVGPSKKVAQLALQDAEVKAARDEFGFAKNDIAIGKFFQKFLDYSGANHSTNTTKRYRAVIDNFNRFLEGYSDIVFISQIKPEHIDLYKVYRRDALVNPNGKPVKSEDKATKFTRKGARAKTINFEIDTLRTIFNIAIKWDYLKDNPTLKVDRLKTTDSKLPRFLTVEECETLLKYMPDVLYPIFFTFLNTGMRKAELEHLEWNDVDFDRRRIKIHRKTDWNPKTKDREIPINQKLYDLFLDLREKNDRGLQSNYVFPHSDGSMLKTKLRRKLIQIAQKAGIKDLTTLHALRHTFASQLIMRGVDLPTVQKLMGHSDIQTTMIYAHLAPDHLEAAVDKLNY